MRVGEVLERVDRLPVTADQEAEIGSGERRDQGLLSLLDTRRCTLLPSRWRHARGNTPQLPAASSPDPGSSSATARRCQLPRPRPSPEQASSRRRAARARLPRRPRSAPRSRSSSGRSRSSSRSAAHFASPTVSPVASTTSSVIAGRPHHACA